MNFINKIQQPQQRPVNTATRPPSLQPQRNSASNLAVPSGPPGTYPPGTVLSVNGINVVVERFLAQGGFAHVYVVLVGGEHQQAVLKRVACPDQETLKDFENEIRFMRQLNGHKNIVRYIDSSVQKLRHGGFEVFILMEYCRGGHLVDFLNTRLSTRLNESEILTIFSDVCEAVAHMHYSNPPIIHRDIKVENVLIANDSTHKLCDFGSATTRIIPPGTPMSAHEIRLLEDEIGKYTTLQYRSPELCDLYQKRGLTEKMDMWALGVLLYKLCFFTTPFEDSGTLAILNVRYTMPSHPSYSRNLLNLIESMLVADVGARADIHQVYSTVCRLRGTPCNLRNKYQDTLPVQPAPRSSSLQIGALSPSANPTDSQRFLAAVSSSPAGVGSLGNHSPPLADPLNPSPGISPSGVVPMRRGRPQRHGKTPSSGNLNADLSTSASMLIGGSMSGTSHNPFMDSAGPPANSGASMNRLTAPPEFFSNSQINALGLGVNGGTNRLTAPPAFFNEAEAAFSAMQHQQQQQHGGLIAAAFSPVQQQQQDRMVEAAFAPVQQRQHVAPAIDAAFTPLHQQQQHLPNHPGQDKRFSAGGFSPSDAFLNLASGTYNPFPVEQGQVQQPQQSSSVNPQSASNPFDPFRRDATRSIPNLKVNTQTHQQQQAPSAAPSHLLSPPRPFQKSSSEVRLNMIDTGARVYGHSRNKSWAQGRSPVEAEEGDDLGGVNVKGLVKQFQRASLSGASSISSSSSMSSSLSMGRGSGSVGVGIGGVGSPSYGMPTAAPPNPYPSKPPLRSRQSPAATGSAGYTSNAPHPHDPFSVPTLPNQVASPVTHVNAQQQRQRMSVDGWVPLTPEPAGASPGGSQSHPPPQPYIGANAMTRGDEWVRNLR